MFENIYEFLLCIPYVGIWAFALGRIDLILIRPRGKCSNTDVGYTEQELINIFKHKVYIFYINL